MSASEDGRAELLALAQRVVDQARPGEQVEAFAQRQVETEVEANGGEIESLSSAETRGVGVRVIVDGRQGYASTAVVDEGGLREALEEARSNADVAQPDDGNSLPAPTEAADVGDQVDASYAATSVDDRIALALRVEAAAREADPRVRGVDAAKYADAYVELALASSEGVALTAARTEAWAYAFVLASEGGETHTGLGVTIAAGPGGVDVEAAGREGAERAVRMLGARKPPTRRLPVVLDPYVTASLLGVLGAALNGEAVLKQRSLFAGRLGETFAPPHVTLWDDGLRPGGLATAPWDAEGVAQQTTALLEGGVLRSYLHDTWTARRTGADARSTGNASRAGYRSSPHVSPTNLYLEPGADGPHAVLAAAGEAVYVQDVMGLHSGANPVTGDFSVSMTGLMVRGGEFAEPVREASIAAPLLDILGGIDRIGSDLRFYPFGGALGGSTVLIAEMSLGGV